jgi:hypothetical protein
VGHPGRVLDQRLNAAQGLAQREQPGARADGDGLLLAAPHLEGHHAAEAVHLRLGDLVVRV